MKLQEIADQLRSQAPELAKRWDYLYTDLNWVWMVEGEDRVPRWLDIRNHLNALISQCVKNIEDHEMKYTHVESCGIEVRIDLEQPDESYIAFTDKHHIEVQQGEG